MAGDEQKRGIVGIFILIGILFFIFLIFSFYTIQGLKGSSANLSSVDFHKTTAPIAVVEVEGVIMDSKKVLRKLFIAENDKNVKAIILRIDSPGGAVGPTQEIYDEIVRIDKIKPIYSSMGTVAASGGYYIAAATRSIYANAGVLTGSIGVIMNFMDLSGVYEFVKVKPETIKAGKFKDIGSPTRPMKDHERLLLAEMSEEVHHQFIDDIFKIRGDKIKGGLEGLREYAQGQIYSGQGAKNLGLIDELGGLWSLARDINTEMKLSKEFSPEVVRVIELKKDFNFREFLTGMEEKVEDLKFRAFNNYSPLLLYQP